MKWNSKLVALAFLIVSALAVSGQSLSDQEKTRQRTTTPAQDKSKDQKKPAQTTNGDRLEPDEKPRTGTDVPEETQANRQEQMSEEAAVVPFYNNFFSTYRLGPEDV